MSVIEYLKKNVSMAFKTLFWKFGRYVCFFILLFLLQALFSTILLIRVNIGTHQRDYLETQCTNSQGYVYHIRLLGLSDTQYSTIRQGEQKQNDDNRYFMIAGGTQYNRYLSTGTAYHAYDVDVAFTRGNIASGYRQFEKKFFPTLEEYGEFTCYETPLLSYTLDATLQGVLTVLLVLVILALATLVLWVLRSALTSHDKFTYGIYMSFGADFKTLFITAFWEMLILNLILFIPSALVGHISAWLLYRPSGLRFTIRPDMSLAAMLLTLTASQLAVYIDFRRTASKPPVKLLMASDNSDVVSSPKTSTNILSNLFPKGVEGITLRRYRKYIAKLLGFTLITSVLFSSFAYFASLCRIAENAPRPQYQLEFVPTVVEVEPDDENVDDDEHDFDKKDTTSQIVYEYSYEGEIKEIIDSLYGISSIEKHCVTDAIDIISHIVVPANIVKSTRDTYPLMMRDSDGVAVSKRALCNVEYRSFDAQEIAALEAKGYRVKGSLTDVLENDDMIAISDSYNNKRELKLKVGDKVNIAVKATKIPGRSYNLGFFLNYGSYIREQMNAFNFEYKEYTVGAIIRDLPTEDCIPIYMNSDVYKQVTGSEVIYSQVDLIIDPDISADELETLDINLRNVADSVSNLKITDLDSALTRQVQKNRSMPSQIVFLALIMLMTAPLIWILMQTLFYQRRHQELDMYFAMGAIGDEMKGLFRFDAIFFAVSGALSYLILGSVFTILVHRLANNPYIYRIFTGEDVALHFVYRYPWLLILVGTLVMGAFGYFGVELSYRKYIAEVRPVFVKKSDKSGKKLATNIKKEGTEDGNNA